MASIKSTNITYVCVSDIVEQSFVGNSLVPIIGFISMNSKFQDNGQ